MNIDAKQPQRTRIYRVLGWAFGLTVIGFAAVYGYYRYTFPYGYSHCCSVMLAEALRQYAEEHGGRFPVGQATPEASLSLLLKGDYGIGAYILRGKTVPLKTVERALKKDGVLGPESCGWHYVEGLTEADNPSLAIVWDKVGLGHNGERLKGGGHEVILVDGEMTFVSGADWQGFLVEQQQLIAKRSSRERDGLPLLTANIKMPDGKMTNCYDGAYNLAEKTEAPNSHGSSSASSSGFSFVNYHLSLDNGKITYVLTLPELQLRSEEVTIQVTNGLPATNYITFVMAKY